jgi:hypothetical protein
MEPISLKQNFVGLMAIDAAHYEGREPAFVKHTFLARIIHEPSRQGFADPV